jgi:hypothetical protein
MFFPHGFLSTAENPRPILLGVAREGGNFA